VKVLVIGGTRFLGRELVWRLLAAGHQVTLLNRGRLEDTFGARVTRLVGDRTSDLERLLGVSTFDAAVDFAAYTSDDGRRVAEVLEGRAGHYVVISSGQVYLVRESCPTPACETDYAGSLLPDPVSGPDKPEWDYGMGKRGLEDELALAWEKRRFPATRLRLPMVNGPRDHFRRIERYLWRMVDGRPILLPGGGERRLRHVYSGSVARAILAMLGRTDTFGQAYNLAQDETPTLAELLRLLAERLGARPTLVDVPWETVVAAGVDPVRLSPFSGRWMSFLDPARARGELGFRHEPLAAYLEVIVAAFLAHPPSEPPLDPELSGLEERLLTLRPARRTIGAS
jgi:nucleoside-diphosphate-sugar epimerase